MLVLLDRAPPPCINLLLQGGFEFSEGASAKWISVVEIEKLRAEISSHVKKTKIVLGFGGKFLIDRLRPTFYNFIFTFPELALMIFS
jgi:hypothetical protein